MIRLYALCLLSSLPMLASAQAEVRRFELTPYGAGSFGGTFDDTDSMLEAELDDSASFGLLFNIRETSNTTWEILFSQQMTDAEVVSVPSGSLEMTLRYLQAGGTYAGDGRTVMPYLAATLGLAHIDIRSPGYDSDTFFAFSIGPGLQFRPHDRVGIRLEARLFGTLLRSDSELFCLSNPGAQTAACAIAVDGDILWQAQAIAGVVLRF